ncbi:MAG: hypothetical protein ACXWT3_14825 [Methylococcaceae bacterium]
MTPIQPRLSESNLFLISAGGPGALFFNEFNPIFNRDGLTFQTSGLAGENNTYSGEEVVAGIYDKASFSLGYSKFKSDGWRANANQEDAIGIAFFKQYIHSILPNQSQLVTAQSDSRRTGWKLPRFLFTGWSGQTAV